ncbi:MAG TPA: biotin--[acetyl-CoA-carboxylase] ligase [bacterium]|nr:biotin--[acetyl-CoA-carboxylase] ligase [bacterium]HPS30532.1 biotin--[acetyl-CoA-carboxylase] ligase [bacterium]
MKEYAIPKNRFKGFYHFNSIDSTMIEAENFIKKGVRSGIVLADMQSDGYGRNSKSWFSPDNGNIYFSFFEKIDPASQIELIPQRTALAVLNTIKHFVKDLPVNLKWPNDILVDMKKVSGIIAKTVQHGSDRFFICGIGVNVYMPECGEFNHTWEVGSIFDSNNEITTQTVLSKLIEKIDSAFSENSAEINSAYLDEISWMKGKRIKFTQDGINFDEGIITGFGIDGSEVTVLIDDIEKEFSTLSISGIE